MLKMKHEHGVKMLKMKQEHEVAMFRLHKECDCIGEEESEAETWTEGGDPWTPASSK